MEIKKGAEAVSSGVPTAAQLEAINAQAKGESWRVGLLTRGVEGCGLAYASAFPVAQ